jgi:hypothetical protein
MSNPASNLTFSPGRSTSGMSKRKMPDTNVYKPPLMKTHLISEAQLSPKHTPSPVSLSSSPFGSSSGASHCSSFSFDDTMNKYPPMANLPTQNKPSSINNLYEVGVNANQHGIYNNPAAPVMNIQHQQPLKPSFSNLMPSHSKTFSLPVDMGHAPFGPSAHGAGYHPHMQPSHMYGGMVPGQLQPPARSVNPNGDIPLPNGWSCERSSTGQFYYIK